METPKYRLFCYLHKAGITAILQLRVHKNQVKCTRNSHGMHTTKRQYNDTKEASSREGAVRPLNIYCFHEGFVVLRFKSGVTISIEM